MYAYQTTEVAYYSWVRMARDRFGQGRRPPAATNEAALEIVQLRAGLAGISSDADPIESPARAGEGVELASAIPLDAARLEIVGGADGCWSNSATTAAPSSTAADVRDDAKDPLAVALGRLICLLTAAGSLSALIMILA